MSGPDLEKPYADACAREERYQEIQRKKERDLWEGFEDEQEAAQFIRRYIADPEALLADVFQRVAIARKAIGNNNRNIIVAPGTFTQALCDMFKIMEGKIDHHVEGAAESLAQHIYHAD